MSRICKYILIGLISAGCAGLYGLPAQADIYKYVDANGSVHFTNTPTSSQFTLYMKEGGSKRSLGDLIRSYADRYKLEEALVKAVIKVESDYNPRAKSAKGALGMMQLLPETAKDMGVRDPFDTEDNIRGGSRYLRLMLNQFNNELELALAAYNAGPGAVKRHGGIPPYEETRNYVDRVKKYLRIYRNSKETVL